MTSPAPGGDAPFRTTRVGEVDATEVGPGIVVHRLYRSGPAPDARRALLVRFAPGSRWPGDDVHAPGPEDVYVASGTFHGLAGAGTVHEAGAFVHCAAGTHHSPSTPTGGDLFVYYPEG
jgi:hypothetical protein